MIIKPILVIVAFFSLGLGALGLFLPLLPTVPFVLLAALCFAKSSTRFHDKLMANKVFGPMIYHWQTSRSVSKKSKYAAIASIGVSGAISVFFIDSLLLQIVVLLVLCVPIVIILSVPTTKALVPNNE